ncbi:MAG: DNA2/NAM7 family helicase, partial [Candidatus Eisenbacteria bacterium]|nr:DNA2/NAM7 family helicase [Candidatus Eisenbacteria bacterium]
QVELDPEGGSLKQLDESLEGYAAWWPTPTGSGKADVLAVVSDPPAVTLRYCTARPPSPGEQLRIYPPLFLESLRAAWLDAEWSRQALEWGRAVLAGPDRTTAHRLPVSRFTWLRRAQREAFTLPGWRAGYLWGPPGTGKTTTLGVMLAQMLLEYPSAKILLASTTNSAVDLALVSVDRELQKLEATDSRAAKARRRMKRIGAHFIAGHYEGRDHLLPQVDEALLLRMVDLETRRPDPASTLAYAAWKDEVELLRALIRDASKRALADASLAALTTTRAIFGLDVLRGLAPYDILVFDEASQVSLPHALALAPIASSVLFAGDPRQLGPIVQSKHPTSKEWLGRTGFELMNETAANTCFLDEQSRMAEPICRIVSESFYDGRLRVARDAIADAAWVKSRDCAPEPNVIAWRVSQPGVWSPTYGGYIRFDSAKRIADEAARLRGYLNSEDIIVLTPFRAQRRLIRSMLGGSNIGIDVSTVHRAQGSERDVVLFDWVHADNGFLENENGQRLINVALSRAKRQLYLLWSDNDLANSLADQIYQLVRTAGFEKSAQPLSRFCFLPNYPACLFGRVVRVGDMVADVIDVEPDGSKFIGVDLKTGRRRSFVAEYVKQMWGGSP